MEKTGDCLLIVDLQNDFCPGGALAVKEGDQIVEPVNQMMKHFSLIATTQDWHPPNHCSFKDFGGPWPAHCIQNTWGAKLHSKLDQRCIEIKILKAQNPAKEAYSGFDGSHLNEELKKRGVHRVFIAGLTTDYCVRTTALDALHYQFETVVLTDLTRAVNVHPGDGERALRDIEQAGAVLATSSDILQGRIPLMK